MDRTQTRKVQIGNVTIGGGAPIAIQSMTNTKTEDVAATVAQIKELTVAGCEIIRCAVPTMEAAFALKENKYTQTPVKSTYGYHVILRLPLDTEWLIANKGTVISNIAASDTNKVIEEILTQAKPSITDAYNEYFSTIK